MNKDKSQHGSDTGLEGIVIRMISQEPITGLGTTWMSAACNK